MEYYILKKCPANPFIATYTFTWTINFDFSTANANPNAFYGLLRAHLAGQGVFFINIIFYIIVPGSTVVSGSITVDTSNTTEMEVDTAMMTPSADVDPISITIAENPNTLVCESGNELDLDTIMCEPCSVGYYQNTSDANLCRACDSGYSTLAEGTIGVENCFYVCDAGFQSVDQLTCTECPIGSYKETEGPADCTQCPEADQITDQIGSTLADQCVGNCSAGYYRDAGGCTQCEEGQYSESMNQDSCTPCDTGLSTSGLGATSVDDCKDPCELQPNYCSNGGECTFANTAAICNCPDPYFGDYCQFRGEPESSSDIIIGATLGGVGGIIFLVLILLCIAYACKKTSKRDEVLREHHADPQMYYPMGVAYPPEPLGMSNPFVYDDPWGAGSYLNQGYY